MEKGTTYQHFHQWLFISTIVAMTFLLLGCAHVPYKYGHDIEEVKTLKLRPKESQIERGRPNKFLDGLGHYIVSLPSKLLLLSWKVDNHKISKEVEEELQGYLEQNDLHNVKVRLNQYAPGGEWGRLFRNRSVGAGWRFTLGIIGLINYTLFPGRLFGGDEYNPYTNTINIYSDHTAILLHEGAHAKDFARRKYKGLYSAIRQLPLLPLYQEAWATGDAVGYYRDKQLVQEEKDAYKVLYPAYGTYIAGEALWWIEWFVEVPIWTEYAVQFGVAIPGHIIGRIKASTVEDRSPSGQAEATESPGASDQP